MDEHVADERPTGEALVARQEEAVHDAGDGDAHQTDESQDPHDLGPTIETEGQQGAHSNDDEVRLDREVAVAELVRRPNRDGN